MAPIIYIASLHRPFNQQLKTSKWVCQFVYSWKKRLTSAELYGEFYYYLIDKLNEEYKIAVPGNLNGLPSSSSIENINNYLRSKTKVEFLEELPKIISSRKSNIEKQIYSTYKASSYYLNLAKDKFALIDGKNSLSSKGIELLKIRSSFFHFSSKEELFYFERILSADFHLFLTHCLFLRLSKKYSLKNTTFEEADFINRYLDIKHFNFTTSSLSNYNVVRSAWVTSLNVVNQFGKIRRKFLEIIESNEWYKTNFMDLSDLVSKFENEDLKSILIYRKKRDQFFKIYLKKLKFEPNDQGYINLYDIKDEMKISYANFQNLLSDIYEREKIKKSIFFNNVVNSIDTRKRFYIRTRPVIKIKIKGK